MAQRNCPFVRGCGQTFEQKSLFQTGSLLPWIWVKLPFVTTHSFTSFILVQARVIQNAEKKKTTPKRGKQACQGERTKFAKTGHTVCYSDLRMIPYHNSERLIYGTVHDFIIFFAVLYIDTSRVSLVFFFMFLRFLSAFASGKGIISQWIFDLPVALPAAARAHVTWHLAAAVASLFGPNGAHGSCLGHMVLPSEKVFSVPPTVCYVSLPVFCRSLEHMAFAYGFFGGFPQLSPTVHFNLTIYICRLCLQVFCGSLGHMALASEKVFCRVLPTVLPQQQYLWGLQP